MTRSQKFGRLLREIEKIYYAVRGENGIRKIENETRNFSVHPAKVFYALYQSIQPECVKRKISLVNVHAAIAEFEKDEFTNDPLDESYVFAYQTAK